MAGFESGEMAMVWLARALVSMLFFWSGLIRKPRNVAAVSRVLATMELPFPLLCLVGAIALEVGGSRVLFVPSRAIPDHIVVAALVCFAAYTMITAVLFPSFWRLRPPRRDHELAGFLGNVGLCGRFC
jgi:uncharacterized membrane protein YphA (DoxX/SURF4 family)